MSTDTDTDTHITARVRAFSGEGVRSHRLSVDAEGTVRVWDPVAGHYTRCHSMSARTCARIRALAKLPAAEDALREAARDGAGHCSLPGDIVSVDARYSRICNRQGWTRRRGDRTVLTQAGYRIA